MSELTKPYQATSNLIGTTFLSIFTVHGAMFYTDEELDQVADEYVKHILDPELSRMGFRRKK
jgi:glutathione-regulated potassium-efflux system ancillary protein KefG